MSHDGTRKFLLSYYPGIVQDLPVISPVARQAAVAARCRRLGEDEIIAAFKSDIFLAAKLVSVANSVFFNMTHESCYTIEEAMLRVGQDYAAALLKKSESITDAVLLQDMEQLWIHSALAAELAQDLSLTAKAYPLPPGSTYWVALVHDIGMLVEMGYDWRRTTPLMALLPTQEAIDSAHCELGHALAEYWDLPKSVKEVIRSHHSSEPCSAEEARPVVGVIRLAHALAEGMTATDLFGSSLAVLADELGITKRRIVELIKRRPAILASLHAAALPLSQTST